MPSEVKRGLAQRSAQHGQQRQPHRQANADQNETASVRKRCRRRQNQINDRGCVVGARAQASAHGQSARAVRQRSEAHVLKDVQLGARAASVSVDAGAEKSETSRRRRQRDSDASRAHDNKQESKRTNEQAHRAATRVCCRRRPAREVAAARRQAPLNRVE